MKKSITIRLEDYEIKKLQYIKSYLENINKELPYPDPKITTTKAIETCINVYYSTIR